MSLVHTYFTTLQRTVRGKTLALAIVVAGLYILLSVYGANRTLIFSIISGDLVLPDKLHLLQTLLIDSWTMFDPLESLLLLATSVLFGVALALMLLSMQNLRGKNGRLKLSFGGSSMIAVMSVGCPGCGISLLSLAGVTTPLLPLHGVPLQATSIMLLTGSLVYTLKKLQSPAGCVIKE